ncbi:MAG: cytochrome c maturation protein CcmE [Acidimicrobiales bacterium]
MALSTGGPPSETPTGLPAASPDFPPAAPPGSPFPTRRRRAFLGSRRRQVVAGCVVAGALAFLLTEGLQNATVYFKTADQAVADKAALGTRQFRIEGTVEPGVRQAGVKTLFSIIANGVSVAVVDTGQPPQLFKVGIPVVLEGHWAGSVYAADQIMVKHTASYVEAHPNRLKSQLPKGTTPAPAGSGGAGAPGGVPAPAGTGR